MTPTIHEQADKLAGAHKEEEGDACLYALWSGQKPCDCGQAERVAGIEKLLVQIAECEAEHPPEAEYLAWCAAGMPDVEKARSEARKAALAECTEPWGDPWCGHPRACSPTGKPEDCGWCSLMNAMWKVAERLEGRCLDCGCSGVVMDELRTLAEKEE